MVMVMSAPRLRTVVVGGGMTGIAAGIAGDATVFEARDRAGGLCATYDVDGFRFEVGGGHWIWGSDPDVDRLLASVAELRTYRRDSAVWFAGDGREVPFPLQDNLWALDGPTRRACLAEIERAAPNTTPAESSTTLDEWLRNRFGPTLHARFFGPFNHRYTAGLSTTIAPDDPAKSPVDLERVRLGGAGPSADSGYNVSYRYPVGGLGALARSLATRCELHTNAPVLAIDPEDRSVETTIGTFDYEALVSTVALPRTMELAGLATDRPDPYTSVLVVNLAALRGSRTPDRQWFYVPDSRTGFHRVGFYSAVEADFLPATRRTSHVSLYAEFAFLPGDRPDPDAVRRLTAGTAAELASWGWIGDVEVSDATWVDVAYTWRMPGSTWLQRSREAVESAGIHVAGRYARWSSDVGGQGIISSLRDGLTVGGRLR